MRKGFEDLELVIVQDIFMTKTAAAADVILPSTSWGEHEGVYTAADRGFQRFFKAVEPKWDLKTDWQIISEIATRMGYPMHYNNTQEIWDELRSLCPDFYGATYEKMGELGYIQWPCRDESEADRGRPISLRINSIPRTGWRSSSPATGSRRSINSPTSIRWCSPPYVKWAITPAAQ